jgi:hypothetical protein
LSGSLFYRKYSRHGIGIESIGAQSIQAAGGISDGPSRLDNRGRFFNGFMCRVDRCNLYSPWLGSHLFNIKNLVFMAMP